MQQVHLARSDTGFVNSRLFLEWGKVSIIPHIRKMRAELSYDGHCLVIMDWFGCHQTTDCPLYRAPGHSDYLLKGKEIEVLWTDVFPNWSDEKARFVHENFGIPLSTVYFWRQKWSQNHEWRPTQTTAHGLQHRIFTDDEEAAT